MFWLFWQLVGVWVAVAIIGWVTVVPLWVIVAACVTARQRWVASRAAAVR